MKDLSILSPRELQQLEENIKRYGARESVEKSTNVSEYHVDQNRADEYITIFTMLGVNFLNAYWLYVLGEIPDDKVNKEKYISTVFQDHIPERIRYTVDIFQPLLIESRKEIFKKLTKNYFKYFSEFSNHSR